VTRVHIIAVGNETRSDRQFRARPRTPDAVIDLAQNVEALIVPSLLCGALGVASDASVSRTFFHNHNKATTLGRYAVAAYVLRVNGHDHMISADPDTPLLFLLRNDLGLNGPKFGCGLAQCGSCAVLRDGIEIRSCVTPVSAVVGTEITTCEGLGTLEKPHPLQAAFVAEQAVQCGYCISGMIVAAAALLTRNPKPSPTEIKSGMDGHLCRCGTYLRILRAVQRAANEGSRI
jgi:nicotinate dehydrogenase subunit A